MPINPFDALNEMQRLEVAEARTDPEKREMLMLTALVQVRDDVASVKDEATAARRFCQEVCKPGTDKRMNALERFRFRLLTIWGVITFLVGLALALWGLLK